MRFETLVFWDMTPRSLEDIYRRFGVMFWLYLEGRRVKTKIYSTETSVHRTMQHEIQEDNNLYIL
jgi:hypothetical protein